MRVFRSISELGEIPGPVVLSIGVFDGVHRGHQEVLRSAIERARAIDGIPIALTFDPHPARVLRPERAPMLLTSTPHKTKLIEAVGFSHLLLVTFDSDFAAKPAEAFVRELAMAAPIRTICVGEGWAFGRGRAGNVAMLTELGLQFGYDVCETPAVIIDGEVVSSTRIREAVERGDLDVARKLLGRDYTVFGTVEKGAQLGRKLGFPTANLRAHNEQFPPNGVYAVRVTLDDRLLTGVANIGIRPTIAEESPSRRLEVHLFDFEGDLYGRELDVNFVAFLRGERKFEGVDALRTQIADDARIARDLLS